MFNGIFLFGASDSAAFDKPFGLSSGRKLRPRASRGELVAGRQSKQKRPHDYPKVLSATTNANKNVFSQIGTDKAL
jgi:hypothetical protein